MTFIVPPYPHCLRCGYEPVEGMAEYLHIHGDGATCCACGKSLADEAVTKVFPAPDDDTPVEDCASCHASGASWDVVAKRHLCDACAREGQGE